MANEDNAPECTIIDGDKYWIQNGQYHRLDGPAIIKRKRAHSWQVNGIPVYSWEEFQEVSGCSDEYLTLLKLKWSPFNCDANPPEEVWRMTQLGLQESL